MSGFERQGEIFTQYIVFIYKFVDWGLPASNQAKAVKKPGTSGC
jgi:hypothetical protein